MRIVASTLLVFAANAIVTSSVAALAGGGPDKDPQMGKLLQEARHVLDSRNPTAAIPKCDAVINAFKEHYGNSQQKIFCARSSAESLGVLLKASVDKTNAIALSSTWSDAYFIRLGRPAAVIKRFMAGK